MSQRALGAEFIGTFMLVTSILAAAFYAFAAPNGAAGILGVAAWVVAGLIAGWLAGASMKSGAYGRIGDVGVGLVGMFAGGWIFALTTPSDMPDRILWAIGVAAASGAAFVVCARVLTRRAAPSIPSG